VKNAPGPLLRPPLELSVAFLAVLVAVIFITMPRQLFLSPVQAYGAAVVFFGLAAVRTKQALRLVQYQRKLIRRTLYRLHHVPSDRRKIKTKLFLGRGFRWRQKHVQRLKEARSPSSAPYLQRAQEGNGDPLLHGVGMLERETEVWSSIAERYGHMIVLGATRVGKTRFAELLVGQDIARGDTVIVLDPKGDVDLLRRIYHEADKAGRLRHFRVLHLRYPQISERYNPIASYHSPGEVASRISLQLPSSGDSAAFKDFAWRFINSIALAMDALKITPSFAKIYRYIENVEPLFQQYHEQLLTQCNSDLWRVMVDYLEAQYIEREKTPKNPAPSKYDLEHYLACKEFPEIEKQHILSQFHSIHESWISTIPAPLQHYGKRTLAIITYVKHQGIEDEISMDLLALAQYDKVYYDKITASLKPLLNKLKSGDIATMLSADAEDQALDWKTVIQQRQIVYVGLDALANAEVARAVGNTLFADLASTIGQIYASTDNHQQGQSKQSIIIHADEFNDIVGPQIHPLLSKAGGAGVQIVAYTQTLADIEASFSSRAEAARIVGNFNAMVVLRVRTLDTARVFSDQVPRLDVIDKAEGSSVADNSQAQSDVSFTSSANERLSTRSVAAVEPSDVMTLPKGEAFAMLDGGAIWKIRIPLLADVCTDLSALDIIQRQKEMAEQQARPSTH